MSVALAELRSLRDSSDHARVTELHRWVRDLGWTGSRPGPVDRPGLDDARSALQSAGADLVTYLWLRDRVVALTVTESGPRLHDLGPWADLGAVVSGLPADLDLAAADLGASLAAGVATSLRRRLARLDAMLVEPLEELGRRRVVLTVPGVLGGVPWAMLPSFAGRSLSSAVSVGWWMGSAGTQRWSGPAAVISGPGTDHGEREAASVADAWSGTCVVGAEATTERASALAAESATLHVTAHGGLSREHPLFSSMRLADGPWFGHDVCQLPQVPSLVVVSACEMGRAVGEYDTLGMARAWLHAGARCVVAAPANIDDARAADVLPRIHRRIAAGVTPADALVPEFADGLHGTGVPILCYGNGW